MKLTFAISPVHNLTMVRSYAITPVSRRPFHPDNVRGMFVKGMRHFEGGCHCGEGAVLGRRPSHWRSNQLKVEAAFSESAELKFLLKYIAPSFGQK